MFKIKAVSGPLGNIIHDPGNINRLSGNFFMEAVRKFALDTILWV